MTKMRKVILIPVFTILFLGSAIYYYYYESEHIISSTRQNEFAITSKCKTAGVFTFAPYVSIQLNGIEVLTTQVSQGYDTLGDCLRSSIKQVKVIEAERKVQILMQNGQMKEIDLIY